MDELDRYNYEISELLKRGQRLLFIYRQTMDKRSEFVQFDLLLGKNIYTSIIIDSPKDEEWMKEFTPPCIVWLNMEKDMWRITEATCLDKKAEEENEEAVKRMNAFSSTLVELELMKYKEGNLRFACTSKMMN